MWRRRYKKISLGERSDENLRKITIGTLAKDIQLIEGKLKVEIGKFGEWKKEKPKLDEYRAFYNSRISPLLDRSFKIQRDPKSYKTSLLGLIRTRELSESSATELKKLNEEIERLDRLIKTKLGPLSFGPEKFNTYEIDQLRHQLNRYQIFLDKKVQKENKIALAKGLAATVTKETRKLGDTVKSKLRLNDFCPYCNRRIVGLPHADHIYPIAKGGLSIERNMVYVCNECNIKKGILTLTAFIKKYQLDRDQVERNLEMLKKDF